MNLFRFGCAVVTLTWVAGACGRSGNSKTKPAAPAGEAVNPAAQADVPPTPLGTLANFLVTFDGTWFNFTPTDDQGRPTGPTTSGAAMLDPVTTPLTLVGIDAGAEGSSDGGTGTPVQGWVLLKQLAPASRNAACDAMAASEGDTIALPHVGTCSIIETRSGFAADELLRTYVEITDVTHIVGTTTFHVNAGSDTDFGLDGTRGVWSHGRLAETGVTSVSGARLDHGRRVWYLRNDADLTAQVSFRMRVKAEPVKAVRRAAPLVGTTACVPDTSAGARVAVSADGRYLAYATGTTACRAGGGTSQIYRFDVTTWANVLVSHVPGSATTGANGVHSQPTISADGSRVSWLSTVDNNVANPLIAPGTTDAAGYQDRNGAIADVYVRDLGNDALRVASVDDNTMVTAAAASANPSISADGKMVVFDTTSAIDFNDGDRNTVADVYRRDLENAMTQLVSPGDVTRVAGAIKGAISAAGGAVAFESTDRTIYGGSGAGISEVFVRSFDGSARFTGLRRVSVTSAGTTANAGAQNAALSADGRIVAFESTASDMLGSSTAGRSHVYVRRADVTGSLVRADFQVGAGGALVEANGNASLPALTREGRMVTFTSTATNLDPLDTNATSDLYMSDVKPTLFETPPGAQDVKRRRAFLISASRTNAVANMGIAAVRTAVSGDARYALAISSATNLVTGATGANLYLLPLR